LLQSMISRNATSSGLRIPLVFVYLVLPLASLLVCIRLLPVLYRDICGKIDETEEVLDGGEI
ncbi:MAG: TRAP transporter small permease, partial [Clostridium sp.]